MVVIIATTVLCSWKVQPECIDESMFKVGDGRGRSDIKTKIECCLFDHHEHAVVCTLLLVGKQCIHHRERLAVFDYVDRENPSTKMDSGSAR